MLVDEIGFWIVLFGSIAGSKQFFLNPFRPCICMPQQPIAQCTPRCCNAHPCTTVTTYKGNYGPQSGYLPSQSVNYPQSVGVSDSESGYQSRLLPGSYTAPWKQNNEPLPSNNIYKQQYLMPHYVLETTPVPQELQLLTADYDQDTNPVLSTPRTTTTTTMASAMIVNNLQESNSLSGLLDVLKQSNGISSDLSSSVNQSAVKNPTNEDIIEVSQKTTITQNPPDFSTNNDIYDEIVDPAMSNIQPTIYSARRYSPRTTSSYDVLKRSQPMNTNDKHLMRRRRKKFRDNPSVNAMCNSKKLADLMSKVMGDDVAISKRRIIEAAETAFRGMKFDVICADGKFSYTVHTQRFCEMTDGNITCFAYR